MKNSRYFPSILTILPIVCVIASAGIVTHQSVRRAQLEKRLAAYEKERTALEKRYKELRTASGDKKANTEWELNAMSAHHDGDGD